MSAPPEDLETLVADPGGAPRHRGPDRRAQPTPRLSRFAMGKGRRVGPRRGAESEGSYVDQYSRRLWVLLVWVAIMNIADSYFTLVHLQAGGLELNPVADALLRTGRIGFVLSKSALIGGALLVLCVHKNFPLARVGLYVSAGVYTLLVAYHLSLFTTT